MNSSALDEHSNNPCRGPRTASCPNQARDESTGLTSEVNSKKDDALLRDICTRGVDFFVDDRACDSNQQSCISRTPLPSLRQKKLRRSEHAQILA